MKPITTIYYFKTKKHKYKLKFVMSINKNKHRYLKKLKHPLATINGIKDLCFVFTYDL